MGRAILKQRCYKVPKDKLDLFLVKVGMYPSSGNSYEVEYIFNCHEYYDVIVNAYMNKHIDDGVWHYDHNAYEKEIGKFHRELLEDYNAPK